MRAAGTPFRISCTGPSSPIIVGVDQAGRRTQLMRSCFVLVRQAALASAAAIVPALRDMFETVLDLPGHGYVDGGDVRTTPNSVMIGLSARTDKAGAEALAVCIDKLGRKARLVATPEGVLHLKTDCSLLDDETVLSTARLARSGVFKDFREIIIPEGEEPAARCTACQRRPPSPFRLPAYDRDAR